MEPELIKSICQEFGPAKWVEQIDGFTSRGWFLLEVNPLPPTDQIVPVVSDIISGDYVRVIKGKGQVVHSDKSQSVHRISNPIVSQAINTLEDVHFKVAINELNPLKDKLFAVVVDPVISYTSFPDHPHLNMGTGLVNGMISYGPDTICYGTVPFNDYGKNDKERYLAIFDEIVIWLFRHQVWESTRKINKPGVWIGPYEKGLLTAASYPPRLNPLGQCRCGSNRLYNNCCLEPDLFAMGLDQNRIKVIKKNSLGHWCKLFKIEYDTHKSLKQAFI